MGHCEQGVPSLYGLTAATFVLLYDVMVKYTLNDVCISFVSC